MIEGNEFAGFPQLCHRNPLDGLRFDFVKGYGAWMIGLVAKYRYQKEDGREFTLFVVGEYWSGPKDIDRWIDQVRLLADVQIATRNVAKTEVSFHLR